MSVLSAIRVSHVTIAAFATVGWFWGSFAALAPQLKAQIGADDATFGLLLLGTSVGLMTTLILAPIFDKAFRSWAMPLAAIGLSAAFLGPGLATGPKVFLVAMVVTGLASGLLDVVMNARVSEIEARLNRPLMNANHGVFSVSYAFGALVTGFSREAGIPPHFIFAGFGVLTLLASTRMFMDVDVTDDTEEQVSKFPWSIVLLCGGVVLIAFMTEAAVESWSALHVERTLGGRAAEGALGPATLGLTMAIGRFGGQAVAERFSELSVTAVGAVLAGAGATVAALAPSPVIAYLGFGTLGLGVSVIGPLGLALVGRLVPPRMRTLAISRTAALGFSGFFIAPALMGLTSQAFGLRVAFGGVAALTCVLFVLIPILRRRGA